MQVRVLFFGVLKDIVGTAEETLQVSPGMTMASLFEGYAERFATLRNRQSSILLARNQEFSTPETELSDGDEVAFLPPVSGGSNKEIRDPEGHLFSLTRAAIHSSQIAAALQRPEDGALVVFDGVVRNNTKGRPTDYLEYECYEGMALEQIARIGREIAGQFPIGRIGIVHRLGRLEIGEASVTVIVTAPHRKAAFEAAFEGINRLKREVPIWKKEFFADGAVWVDGEWDDRLLAAAAANETP
ncbi:MAG: molybdenum cofactor biosynthesis protein MoaE [Acidobacteriaceae bacterium]|nr:molybdenum cofactor biosynthesis protein MoaE [Acidobacteriaceae bacterium]MBV8572760.1 molybdenum cofactor biosynthesis protein MoaE [Acidobacteriaceae bacterium]